MDKEELLLGLKECREQDTESGHLNADALLIRYIDDEDIEKAYNSVNKWYA